MSFIMFAIILYNLLQRKSMKIIFISTTVCFVLVLLVTVFLVTNVLCVFSFQPLFLLSSLFGFLCCFFCSECFIFFFFSLFYGVLWPRVRICSWFNVCAYVNLVFWRVNCVLFLLFVFVNYSLLACHFSVFLLLRYQFVVSVLQLLMVSTSRLCCFYLFIVLFCEIECYVSRCMVFLAVKTVWFIIGFSESVVKAAKFTCHCAVSISLTFVALGN